MNGVLGPSALSPSTVTPVLVLTASVGLLGGVLSAAGRRLRRRALRRRAAGLEPARQGESHRRDAPPPDTEQLPPGGPRRLRAELVVPLPAGLLAAFVVGGPVGLLVGVLVGAALRYWLPRARSSPARRAAREADHLLTQLPLTAELLAACLSSSGSPAQAVAAVARTVGGPMRTRLASVSAQLSLGAPAAACWERLGSDCPPLAPMARCLVRTSVSGTPPAAPLAGLAVSQRAAAGRAAHARVRRAGVLATAPLGLCFLPAFVLIGVVPVVMGLAASFTHQI